MQLHSRLATTLTLAALMSASATGQTTTIPFDGISWFDLVQGYGDRVTGATTGAFTYGGSGTYTPNVEVAFGAAEGGLSNYLYPWSTGYNDLINVVYTSVGGGTGGSEMLVTLIADPGYRVALEAFDIGNWGVAITLPYVRVTDQNGAVLFEELNVALNESTSTVERNFVLSPAPTAQILTLRISIDMIGFNNDNVGLDNVRFRQQAAPTIELGTTYCAPAVPNSGAGSARMRVWGQPAVAANDVRLVATSLPHGSFGFFLASRTQGFVANAGGGQGTLCLGGAIGRYVGPGQIKNAGGVGVFELDIDLTRMPSPTGPLAAQAGQTWNFQAWYRDANPNSTSNFTDGVSLLLQ